MTEFGSEAARSAAAALRSRVKITPRVGIILGSGLGGIADVIEDAVRVPFRDVPGFPAATIAGHAGQLIAGRLGATPVIALSGRFHMYEGHGAALAAFPVRVMHALGAGILIVSNAAGAVRPELNAGAVMLLSDHVNFMFRNPLIGSVEEGDERFPDMSAPYDSELRALAQQVALEQGIALDEGVYIGLLGPSYETPAEARMLARLGADVVGMSTVPEVIVARAMGMRVLGFSCVTNAAGGLAGAPITHTEVIETTAKLSAQLQRLVRGIVSKL